MAASRTRADAPSTPAAPNGARAGPPGAQSGSCAEITVVLAAGGYPGSYQKGMRITGLDQVKNKLVFHAGTVRDSHDILTAGGRVLNVVGFGNDLPSAIKEAYDIAKEIEFNSKFYRQDIGKRGLKYLKEGV